MQTVLIVIGIGLVFFIPTIFVLSRLTRDSGTTHTKKALERIAQEGGAQEVAQEPAKVLRDERRMADSDFGEKLFQSLPGAKKKYDLLLKSGVRMSLSKLYFMQIMLFLVSAVVLKALIFKFPINIIFAALIAILVPKKILQHKIHKRNEQFVQMFPDAVDMIVRSVRSGHPLNAAMRMIVDNMDPPVSTEFKKVVDEVVYGRSLSEALIRMSQRVAEPDVNFFVVVLSVQQETGGNLAEILSNLSGIIRKRKQLRMKIKAMTSEGRFTSYILGGLPIFVLGVIHITSPTYLVPLWTTTIGNIILGVAISLIVGCMMIVKKMVNIDI